MMDRFASAGADSREWAGGVESWIFGRSRRDQSCPASGKVRRIFSMFHGLFTFVENGEGDRTHRDVPRFLTVGIAGIFQ